MSARIVIVGGGFAGLAVARRLEKRLTGTGAGARVEVRLVCPTDFMLYLPLLPQVAAGVLPARAAVVALSRRLRATTLVPGRVVGADLEARRLIVDGIAGDRQVLGYDRLVLCPGSVTRVPDLPGLREHGRGMKTLAEAAFLRDHVLAQLEIAAAGADPDERARRCRFVVVGGGYAGVETAAHLQLMTRELAGRLPRLDPAAVQWHLVQHAGRLLPHLDDRLGESTLSLLRRRGITVHLDTGVERVDDHAITLADGRQLATRTVIWTAGVAPNPLMAHLGRPTDHGRLVVGADLALTAHPEVFALGDAAAVPDLTVGDRTGDDGAPCPPTAQHAIRQAPVAADNVVAGLTGRPARHYRHHDLGLVVDLGGRDAVAQPLGTDLSGRGANLLTRAYHLWALRAPDAVRRTATNWALHRIGGHNPVRLGFRTDSCGRLADLEHTDDYLTTTGKVAQPDTI